MVATVASAAPPSYREAHRAARQERRTRASARAKTHVDAGAVRDPLSREDREHAPAALVVVGSLALHGALLLLLVALAPAAGERKHRTFDEPVHVQIREPERQEPIKEPEPPRDLPKEPARKELPVPTPPRIVKQEETPPPDPIDVPKEPETPAALQKPARRVTGLSMSSVTTAGAGPAFATGNTRMGQTAETAEDPSRAGKLAPTFTPPRRTNAVTPTYPAALRGANIEGDVGLRVEIDASGHVTNVTVTNPSAHEEFNRAAKESALASSYEPARANGAAVAQAIEFTVRFRLRQ